MTRSSPRGRYVVLGACALIVATLAALAACGSAPEAAPDAPGPAALDEPARTGGDGPCVAWVHGQANVTGPRACVRLGRTEAAALTAQGLAGPVIRSLVLAPGHHLAVWTDPLGPSLTTSRSALDLKLPGPVVRLEITPLDPADAVAALDEPAP